YPARGPDSLRRTSVQSHTPLVNRPKRLLHSAPWHALLDNVSAPFLSAPPSIFPDLPENSLGHTRTTIIQLPDANSLHCIASVALRAGYHGLFLNCPANPPALAPAGLARPVPPEKDSTPDAAPERHPTLQFLTDDPL